jgi:hypothetical protein
MAAFQGPVDHEPTHAAGCPEHEESHGITSFDSVDRFHDVRERDLADERHAGVLVRPFSALIERAGCFERIHYETQCQDRGDDVHAAAAVRT